MSDMHIEKAKKYEQGSLTKVDIGNKFLTFEITKRIIDLLLSSLGIVLTLPIFIIIAISIKWKEPTGKLFFSQERLGKDGKVFKIYKFRSMIINADEALHANPLLYKKYLESDYKLEPHEDPRITRVGKFLRKTSLDELPQMLNVLKGEMSLIGPRPIVKEEILEYGDKKDIFLSVKPGLTGYWQVSGRSQVKYPERVDLELYYVYNRSIIFDLKIFFLTFWIVLTKRGAY